MESVCRQTMTRRVSAIERLLARDSHKSTHTTIERVMTLTQSPPEPVSFPLTPPMTPPAPMLPPCRVCGEKASGFHYGVNTCEACKGFFRRSLRRLHGYKCSNNGRCEILPGKRSTCAACRLAKCLALGMSKNAIKTGRYTHAKRAKDISEVKNLGNKKELAEDMEPDTVTPSMVLDTSTEDGQIIQVLTAAYIGSTVYTPEYIAALPAREQKYLEQRAYREQMFGPLRPVAHEEYKAIYQATGIDVDGRREMIVNILPCLERTITKYIDFAKMLPGFKKLPMEDQVALIKASRFDCWMLSVHQATNTEQLLFTNTSNVTVYIDDMKKLDKKGFVDEFFRLAKIMKKLKLKTTEIALLQGVCLLFADRVELKESAIVEACQAKIVHALRLYLKHTYPDDPCRIASLLLAVTELRSAAHVQHNPVDDDLFSEDDIHFPPLVLEMWSTK